MAHNRFLLGMIGLLSACTWISDEKYNAELINVDDDGDGVTLADGDCNDANPNIAPNLEEIWYDGIDSDCGGDNDFDVDKDGFVPPEHEGKMTTSHVEVLPLPGGDCNDEDPNSYPNAQDVMYDGVDSDCSGNDDYDMDEDGYVPAEYDGLLTANLSDQTEALPSGDCNDEDPTINPGIVENWYDGIDSDCGGENDYDRDNDGFAFADIPPTADIGDLQPGDCNDDPQDNNGDGIADGFPYNPGATEIWYDGLDYNCLGDDDYDQDGDGYVPTQYEGDKTEGLPFTGNLPGGDCDDLDPERYEGALEILSDAAKDYDCDLCVGDDCSAVSDDALGASSFLIMDTEWLQFASGSDPHDIQVSSNGNELFVSTRTDEVTTINPNNNSIIYFFSASFVSQFDLNNMSTSPTQFFRWRGKTDNPDIFNPYSDRQAVTSNNNFFIGAVGQLTLNQSNQPLYRRLRISAKSLQPTGYYHLDTRTNSYYPQVEDVGILLDSNNVIHAVGCESDTGLLQYARKDSAGLNPGLALSLDVEMEIPDMHMSECELYQSSPTTGTLVAYNNGEMTEYTFPLTGTAGTITFTPSGVTNTNYASLTSFMLTDKSESSLSLVGDSIPVIVDPTGIWVNYNGNEYQVSAEVDVKDAYGVMTANDELIIGYATANGEGKLMIGDPNTFLPTNTLTTYDLTSDYVIEEVVPYPFSDAEGDKLFVTFLGYDGLIPKMGFGIAKR